VKGRRTINKKRIKGRLRGQGLRSKNCIIVPGLALLDGDGKVSLGRMRKEAAET
jgi:hypothetical protein